MRTWIVSLALFAIAPAHADDRDFSALVTHVFDGDSFVVRPTNPQLGREIEVRLNDIDAPEKDQPHADAARSALIKLIEGRRVFVDVLEIDRYDRKVAKVYREPDRLDITRALVRAGHVWVNRKFADDHSLVELEDQARAARTGLWSRPDADRMPPWQFRRQRNRERSNHKDHKGSGE